MSIVKNGYNAPIEKILRKYCKLGIPAKIEIGSYITKEKLEEYDLNLKNIHSPEKDIKVAVQKTKNGKYELGLEYVVETNIADLVLVGDGQKVEYKQK